MTAEQVPEIPIKPTKLTDFIRSRGIRIATLMLFGSFSLASHPVYACSPGYSYEAVVLSFEDLRQPIHIQAPQEIGKNGKILLYKHYLLINEPDKGIHIYDNQYPETPIGLGFLPIPGSSDLSIKDDVLYTDSYVDLVMIDVKDPTEAHSVARIENTFSPRYSPRSYGVDPDEGVVIDLKIVY
jgi:Uncharacterized conserved protein